MATATILYAHHALINPKRSKLISKKKPTSLGDVGIKLPLLFLEDQAIATATIISTYRADTTNTLSQNSNSRKAPLLLTDNVAFFTSINLRFSPLRSSRDVMSRELFSLGGAA